MYAAAWSANADFVVFGQGKSLVVKPILPSGKQEQWKAHEGTILQVDWNAVNGLIVSGSEDRKYKVPNSIVSFSISMCSRRCGIALGGSSLQVQRMTTP